jgi:hypothetical protein
MVLDLHYRLDLGSGNLIRHHLIMISQAIKVLDD